MTLYRSIAAAIFGFAFNLSLFLLIATYFLSIVTSYTFFSYLVSTVVSQQINQSQLENIELAKIACQQANLSFEILPSINITCQEILKVKRSEIPGLISQKISNASYEKGACSFINCSQAWQKILFDLFTSKGNKKVVVYFQYSLIATLVFGVLFFVSLEGLKNKFRKIGSSLIITSLPFLAANFIGNYNFGLQIPNEVLLIIIKPLTNLGLTIFSIGLALFVISFFIKRKS